MNAKSDSIKTLMVFAKNAMILANHALTIRSFAPAVQSDKN
jgi:hypothetical protein